MPITSTESIFQFDEGLIGFYDCKSFLLIEREEIAPFRWLQSTDRAGHRLPRDRSLTGRDGLQDCHPQPGMGVFRTREPGSRNRACDLHGGSQKTPKAPEISRLPFSSTTKEEPVNR